MWYVLFVGHPNPPDITVTYNNNPPYSFNEGDSYNNGTTIPVEVTDEIKITASVSCTKPAVNLVWTRPGGINNNKVVPCADDLTFTSESELRIENATKDDTGQISLQISHPLLTETYNYQLLVNGKYMILQEILKTRTHWSKFIVETCLIEYLVMNYIH